MEQKLNTNTAGIERPGWHLLENAEIARLKSVKSLDEEKRSERGQFFTSSVIAEQMAGLVELGEKEITILDPGAGVGILTAALIEKILREEEGPSNIHVDAYEIDENLLPFLRATLEDCQNQCEELGISFSFEVKCQDYIQVASFFPQETYDIVIMNPPYGKINTNSKERAAIENTGLKTTNLYSIFVYLALQQLKVDGQLIAITPRSFCNGTYFRPFRKALLNEAAFKRIHIYNSRSQAFKDSDVLQENIIYKLQKGTNNQSRVVITASDSPGQQGATMIEVPHEHVINPGDPNVVLHVIEDELARHTMDKIYSFEATLDDLGIQVSTGKVVDFRAKEHIVQSEEEGAVPLLYPNHFNGGNIQWPTGIAKKEEAILYNPATEKSLIESGFYVLVKRFTAKEERRRVVSAVLEPEAIPTSLVGLENHLNYFHAKGDPLKKEFAWGLSAFLNSKLVDMYFRIFNGHTQINATDLRSLRYPTREQLIEIGRKFTNAEFAEEEIDSYLEKQILPRKTEINPVEASKRIETTIEILKQLGLPKAQQNERSALTLLALLDLGPDDDWSDASAPMLGITEMMNYFEENYGKTYAPNSRETVRRFTVHQFEQAGIVVANPDEPRPPNSPNYVYQIEPKTLALLQKFEDENWENKLKEFLAELPALRDRYAAKREKERIPIKVNDDKQITISPGGQNKLV